MDRKNTGQLLQELMDSNDLDRVLSENATSFREDSLTDALPRLWEAYYQADPSRSAKGDGLGLSIAKTVFDLHGFTCGAENTEIGPKFWFQFADK